jgi:hypothetical protein
MPLIAITERLPATDPYTSRVCRRSCAPTYRVFAEAFAPSES